MQPWSAINDDRVVKDPARHSVGLNKTIVATGQLKKACPQLPHGAAWFTAIPAFDQSRRGNALPAGRDTAEAVALEDLKSRDLVDPHLMNVQLRKKAGWQ